MSHNWGDLLSALIDRHDLAPGEVVWAMNQIYTGSASTAQFAAFAVALRAKGESAAEVSGMADVALQHAHRVRHEGRVLDIVGTGGDRSGTVNISTMATIVTAAAGIPVIKHGNRAASSKCGTADVLEYLGVAIELQPEQVERCFAELGVAFCFAPVFHPAARHAREARSELKIPTVFNFLGPLTNPADPEAGLIGCADLRMAPLLAQVFAGRGASVLLVRGDDGLDEITTTTTTSGWVVADGAVRQVVIDPADLDIPRSDPSDLLGGDAAVNAAVVRDLVAGKTGPVRDAVLVNAAAAHAAYRGFGSDVAADLRAALPIVAEAIDSGAAAALLDRWAGFHG
ncbi:anthranilate phosphoribosyltransferase [Pseudonocardiaceae bacterium YIM PH 21723]|nr:anthranilate phosphoribosyltransferase [Pseudonocardiaceae bacterium YIM PH 21723]